ncbi:MAG: FG-GAP-like repeat-containing protein [Bacteroidetes bacterium]|nr:FG-GAP-like repeat-containing protein [Bacteroidota bacterium]
MGHFVIFVRFSLQGFPAIGIRWLFLTIIACFFNPWTGLTQSFIRVNSGTKSEIHKIMMTRDGKGYFLTDKIFHIEGDAWKKVDLPVSGTITSFYALSNDELWFSTLLETSTSMLYHHHDGITENIHSPFGNNITDIFFTAENLGFFASYSDAVIYHKGVFQKVKPVSASGYITKIIGFSTDKVWAFSQYNELFVFDNGSFLRVFADKKITDFEFITPEHGFILCDDAIIELNGLSIVRQYQNSLFRNAKKICVRDNELWVIGEGGLILVLQNGILRQIKYEGKEKLNSIAFNGKNDIWIAGDNGLLLYSGIRNFPVYNERYPGFSAQKLIVYGIEVDNEYGVAFADFNGDDKNDIYAVCISDPNRLYINSTDPDKPLLSTPWFSEDGIKRGATGATRDKQSQVLSELKLGVAVADVDNDGDEDIYLCSLNGKNKLLLNNGKGYFRNVTEQHHRACEDMHRSNAAAFADVDLDGDVDLFVTSEQGSNRLYLNDGNGYFTDVTDSAGVASPGGGMCVSFCDVNEDGYPDLCATFWYPSNKVYLNETRNGKVKFRDITRITDLAKSEPAKSNGVVFADVNNDGHSDLFIANRHVANKLYLNNGKGIFRDATSEYFENKVYLTNGAVFADFDLDGFQDLYITNVGENVMYRNINGKYFTEVTGNFGAELSGYCTGSAAGDIDNDGDVDLYSANFINGSSILFLNKMEKKNAVTFKLSGTRSNRNAIGAKIYLYSTQTDEPTDCLMGVREISGGGGYASISAKEAIFALNPGKDYYAVVRFPASGSVVRINDVKAGAVIRVKEESGFAAYYTFSKKAVIRFFTDPEVQLEMAKYAAVFLILMAYLYFLRKGPARIGVIRWMMSLVIFIVFALVDQVFLFSSSILLFFISPVVAIIGLIILHLITERMILKREAEQEKVELREKISRDLHDDLASTLGSISIYSSTLKGINNVSPLNFQKLSDKISELTQTALQSITDIIWMTAPRNDSVRSLISKVSAMTFDLLTDNGIRFEEKVELPDHEIILRDKLRHDAFLILKEALNNIIRHGSARHVTLRTWYHDNTFFIQLTDDGKGFNVNELPRLGSHGNGLINMHRRASESGIDLKVQSTIGSGSRIEIFFKI